LRRADQLQLAAAAGLWRLLEEGRRQLDALHAGGLAHGDAELQNFIVCPAPLEVLLIDFEAAVRRDAVDEATWLQRCAADRAPMLKEAVFLQAVLGRQPGALADEAWQAVPNLFRDPDRMRRAIEQLGVLNP
jgi:serine/threonine protein kinase